MFSQTSPSFFLNLEWKNRLVPNPRVSAPSLPKCHLWIRISYVTFPIPCGIHMRIFLRLSYTFRSLCHMLPYCACGEDLNLLSQFGCCQPLPAFIPIKLLKHFGLFVLSVVQPYKETRSFQGD